MSDKDLRLPPSMLRKVIGFKSMKHKDGKFYLWDVPCSIVPLFSLAYLQKMLENRYSDNEAAEIMFNMGALQTEVGSDLISERFGYAKTYADKTQLLRFITEQTQVAGNGTYEWKHIDEKNKVFIVRGSCPQGEYYKRMFGLRKDPVDHFMRGEGSVMIRKVFGIKDAFCIETKCVVRGDSYCEFMIKPLSKWDKKDKNFKKQNVKLLSIKELNSKIKASLVFG